MPSSMHGRKGWGGAAHPIPVPTLRLALEHARCRNYRREEPPQARLGASRQDTCAATPPPRRGALPALGASAWRAPSAVVWPSRGPAGRCPAGCGHPTFHPSQCGPERTTGARRLPPGAWPSRGRSGPCTQPRRPWPSTPPTPWRRIARLAPHPGHGTRIAPAVPRGMCMPQDRWTQPGRGGQTSWPHGWPWIGCLAPPAVGPLVKPDMLQPCGRSVPVPALSHRGLTVLQTCFRLRIPGAVEELCSMSQTKDDLALSADTLYPCIFRLSFGLRYPEQGKATPGQCSSPYPQHRRKLASR